MLEWLDRACTVFDVFYSVAMPLIAAYAADQLRRWRKQRPFADTDAIRWLREAERIRSAERDRD